MKPAKVVIRHLKKLDRLYETVLRDFKEDDVHRFRVRVKRFRAFLRLLKHAVARPGKLKLPQKIRDLYHFTGSVRNLQLQRQRLPYVTTPGEAWPGTYLKWLEMEEHHWKQRAEGLAGGAAVLNKCKRYKHGLPQKLKRKQRKNFLWEKAGALHHIVLLEQWQDRDLHQLRKILKDILYTWDYVAAYMVFFVPASWSSRSQIEAFTEELGTFQDLCITLDLLSPTFMDPTTPAAEVRTIENIKRQLELDKHQLKTGLCQKIIEVRLLGTGFENKRPSLVAAV